MKRENCELLAEWLGEPLRGTAKTVSEVLFEKEVRRDEVGFGGLIYSPALGLVAGKRLSKMRADEEVPGWISEPPFRWVLEMEEFLRAVFGGAEAWSLTMECLGNQLEASGFKEVIEGALIAPDATAERVAVALGFSVDLVEAYADLFFNVLDRREEAAYTKQVVEMPWRLFSPSPEAITREVRRRTLLQVGYRTDLETVLRFAGFRGKVSRSLQDLGREIHQEVLMELKVQLAASSGSERGRAKLVRAAETVQKVMSGGAAGEAREEDEGVESMHAVLSGHLMAGREKLDRDLRQQIAKQRTRSGAS